MIEPILDRSKSFHSDEPPPLPLLVVDTVGIEHTWLVRSAGRGERVDYV